MVDDSSRDIYKVEQAKNWFPGNEFFSPFPRMYRQLRRIRTKDSMFANLAKCNVLAGPILIMPQVTYCQERLAADKTDTSSINNFDEAAQLRQDVATEKARVQAELDRLEHQSCLSCLVTGVGTCLGLAGYFGYMSMEEMHIQPVTRQVRQRIAFFGVVSVGWIGAGAYRLYLG